MSLSTFPLLAMTVMLWMLWSDTVRPHKSSRVVYLIRMVLLLAMIGSLFYNLAMYPAAFNTTARVLVGLASMVGIAGAVYFFRRAMAVRPR